MQRHTEHANISTRPQTRKPFLDPSPSGQHINTAPRQATGDKFAKIPRPAQKSDMLNLMANNRKQSIMNGGAFQVLEEAQPSSNSVFAQTRPAPTREVVLLLRRRPKSSRSNTRKPVSKPESQALFSLSNFLPIQAPDIKKSYCRHLNISDPEKCRCEYSKV